ncbi:putative nucleotidyltransferase, ribonuclease H [Tanacetum coccineum]
MWDEECQAAFESLKKVVMKEPSQKLNETKRKYTVQEKEMTAVVHCLRIWRHYLLGLRFVIKTDNIATSYLQTQKKLSPKQAHWQDFLAEFDYRLKYKPRKANVVADTLSRKAEFTAITQAQFFLQDRIKEGLEHDPLAKKIIALAKDGRTRRFWLKGDMLFTKGDRLYVPKWGDLRRAILKECHDSKWAGHPGITRMLALVEGTYYWPRMGDDVDTFESVSMDFITCLPKSKGGGSIIVVDRFSKYGTFIAAPPDVTADDTAKLFFKNVVKYWGVQHAIVSDRDPRITRRFWTELFKIMGTDLNFSTIFISKRKGKQRGKATGKSPFELVTRRQPLTPNALAASYKGSSPTAYKTIKEWHEQVDLARASLDKAAKKMKKCVDEKRRHVEFEVGDQVMVKLLPQQFKSSRKVHKGLIQRRGVPNYKEYLIKLRDLPDSEASWEAEDLLWRFADKIKRYHEDGTTRTSRLSGILWKVGEGLGSSWKPMEAPGRPKSFL